MPEEQYHKLVDQTLDDLLERLEVQAGTASAQRPAGHLAPPVKPGCVCGVPAHWRWVLLCPALPQAFVEDMDLVEGDVEYSVGGPAMRHRTALSEHRVTQTE